MNLNLFREEGLKELLTIAVLYPEGGEGWERGWRGGVEGREVEGRGVSGGAEGVGETWKLRGKVGR